MMPECQSAIDDTIGTRVSRVWFDGQTGFLFESGWSLEINVEAIWTASGRKPVTLDVGNPAPISESLLSLLWSEVTSMSIDEPGQALDFESKAGHLRIDEVVPYEGWQLNGPRDEMIIATPGHGGLAIWGPRSE